MAGWLKWAAAGMIAAGSMVGAQVQLERTPPPVLDVNMLFVPPETLTKGLAAGYENMVADGLWLGLLQYYGDRVVKDDKRCVNLGPMFQLITDLDPQFWFAYWLGAWALEDNDESDAAVALLKKGAAKNPTDYNYPYLEGYIQYLGRHDQAAAAKAFERAAGLPEAPRFARTMAARMYEEQNQGGLALAIWRNLSEHAEDRHTREIAKRNVERILAELAGQAPKAFHKRPKRRPVAK